MLSRISIQHATICPVFEVAGGEFDAARLAVAAAATSQHIDKVEFVVFDGKLATELDIPIDKTQGKTLDQHANPLHRDLKIGSGKKLCALTEALIDPRFKVQRLAQFEVAERIRNAIKNGSIDQDKLEESMREALKKFPPRNTKEVTK